MAFQQTDNYIPVDAGGGCYFCGASQRHVVLPTGGSRPELLFRWDGAIDYEGSVVICEACIADLARACGWSTPEDTYAARQTIVERDVDLEVMTARAVAAEGLVDALRTYDGPVSQLPVPDGDGERITAAELAADNDGEPAPAKRGPGRPKKTVDA